MKIAFLHPQCRVQGGAIKMALLAVQSLQSQGNEVTLYTFDHSPDCFADLQKGLTIVEWGNISNSPGIYPPWRKGGENQNEQGGLQQDQSQNPISPLEISSPLKGAQEADIIGMKKTAKKLFRIISLAWHVRHVDIVVANNPPMQIVAALAKVFSLSSLSTVWWHHHAPWYYLPQNKAERINNKSGFLIFIKSFLERQCIIPFIDQMVATSHFVADQIRSYCGREAEVIHPIVSVSKVTSPPGIYSPWRKGGENQNKQGGLQQEPSQNPSFPQNVSIPLKGELEAVSDTESASSPSSKRAAGNAGGIGTVILFTHGRLEAGKGLDTIVNVWKRLQITYLNKKDIHLMIAGSGSLDNWAREQGAEVMPFDRVRTFDSLKSGLTPVIAVYASTIDAFGLAPLEAQMSGLPTVILDRGGARETILTDMSGNPVGHLVQSEEEIFASISHFLEHKLFPKPVSIVNFFHTIEYFSPDRIEQDLLILMSKIGNKK